MKTKRYIACCLLVSLLSGCSVLDSITREKDSSPSIPDAVLEEHEGKMPTAESLPIYPEQLKNKLDVCVADMQVKAENAFITLINAGMQQNVMLPNSAVYIAPYVIDAKYNDCINTINSDLYEILSKNGFAPIRDDNHISQNSG